MSECRVGRVSLPPLPSPAPQAGGRAHPSSARRVVVCRCGARDRRLGGLEVGVKRDLLPDDALELEPHVCACAAREEGTRGRESGEQAVWRAGGVRAGASGAPGLVSA